MARRLLTALVAVCALALSSKNSLAEAKRGFVDRHRELQDVNMGEEEVGAFGQEQTVIEASMKDSTTAKSTSALHVPHKDATIMDHQVVNIEDQWTDEDIKVMQGIEDAKATKDVKINSSKVAVEDGQVGEDGDQLQEDEGEKEPELTEDEIEAKKLSEENQKIEENFEAYSQLDAAEETKKLQEKEMAKNKKKAEIHLLEPRGRTSDNRGYGNKGPCGGTEKGPIHYMASSGSRNYIQWKTLKSHKSANCTVSMSSGGITALDYKILRPRDDSANHEGKFPCGRNAGFEGKEFRLPSDTACTNCILQFVQEISAEESIHQCADLTILERITVDPMAALKAKQNGCGGACLNGGQCQNGECNCRDGFEGTFCDEEQEGIAAELIWFFIITIVLLVAVALFFKGKEIKARVNIRFGQGAVRAGREADAQDRGRLVDEQNNQPGGARPPRD